MKKKQKPQLPRAPLPRQTGGYHRPDKGRGAYNRQQNKLKVKKEEQIGLNQASQLICGAFCCLDGGGTFC